MTSTSILFIFVVDTLLFVSYVLSTFYHYEGKEESEWQPRR